MTPLDPGLPEDASEDLRDEPAAWPVHASRDLWRGAAPFAVRMDTLSHPDSTGERFDRLMVEHPGAVVVLALDDDERVLLLRQYRHAVQSRVVELPAGLLDQPGEDPVEAGRRELLEETGHTAAHWTPLLSTWSTPGILDERIDFLLARGLEPAPHRNGFDPAHEEADMTLSWARFGDLLDAVLDGRLADGPLVQAVLAYALRRDRDGGAAASA